MKEQIDTIPVNDAFLSGDECPFCYLERMAEQKALRFTLGPGASYMEPDVRGVTDSRGFCRQHMKKMYDYGNALGNALMLQTYYTGLLLEFDQAAESFTLPPKKPFLGKRPETPPSELQQMAQRRQATCYICDKIDYNMHRYFHTFFVLLNQEEFRQRVAGCKGFCMHHFAQLLELAPKELRNDDCQWFYDTVISLMRSNLQRVRDDLDWFVGMFDYRNAGRDWKTSRDAVTRAMQKLQGGHPSDPTYKTDP